MIYAYWQLSAQDLLTWIDDVPRKVQKLVLVVCWATSWEELVRYQDEDEAKDALVALDRIKC